MDVSSRLVIAVRSRVPGPILASAAVCLLSAAIVAAFAQSTWAWAMAVGCMVGASMALLLLCKPRKGELLRLLVDRERRILYWVHRGGEAEEVPFGVIRAIALEPVLRGRRLNVYAVDTTAKWVPLGGGPAEEIERFARSIAAIVGARVWYRRQDEPVLPQRSETGLIARKDHR